MSVYLSNSIFFPSIYPFLIWVTHSSFSPSVHPSLCIFFLPLIHHLFISPPVYSSFILSSSLSANPNERLCVAFYLLTHPSSSHLFISLLYNASSPLTLSLSQLFIFIHPSPPFIHTTLSLFLLPSIHPFITRSLIPTINSILRFISSPLIGTMALSLHSSHPCFHFSSSYLFVCLSVHPWDNPSVQSCIFFYLFITQLNI